MMSSEGSGSTGSRPCRIRANAASVEGDERGERTRLLHGRWPRQVRHGTPGRDRGPQGVHRLRGRGECAEHRQDLGRDRAGRHPVRRIPVAGPEQVRDRAVGAVLDEVADPVAAIQESTALAVDHAQRGLARDHAVEAGRVGPRVFRGSRRGVCHAAMVAEHPRTGRAGWPVMSVAVERVEDEPDPERPEDGDDDGPDEARRPGRAPSARRPSRR